MRRALACGLETCTVGEVVLSKTTVVGLGYSTVSLRSF